MTLGIMSILILLQPTHPYKVTIVAAFIIFGGVIDFFDGFIARKLNAETILGKQLDSFADIITFGIAPIMLINYITHGSQPVVLMAVSSLAFMLAGAYRLARFNLNDFSKYFLGMPITAAGIALVIFGFIYKLWVSNLIPILASITVNAVILGLAAMMISKRKFRRF